MKLWVWNVIACLGIAVVAINPQGISVDRNVAAENATRRVNILLRVISGPGDLSRAELDDLLSTAANVNKNIMDDVFELIHIASSGAKAGIGPTPPAMTSIVNRLKEPPLCDLRMNSLLAAITKAVTIDGDSIEMHDKPNLRTLCIQAPAHEVSIGDESNSDVSKTLHFLLSDRYIRPRWNIMVNGDRASAAVAVFLQLVLNGLGPKRDQIDNLDSSKPGALVVIMSDNAANMNGIPANDDTMARLIVERQWDKLAISAHREFEGETLSMQNVVETINIKKGLKNVEAALQKPNH